MNAIILAAGLSSRMNQLTHGKPKCLLSVLGLPVLQRLILGLDSLGVRHITVAAGPHPDDIQSVAFPRAEVRVTTGFATCNNLHTLFLCADALVDDVIVTFADLILETAQWSRIVEQPGDIVLGVERGFCVPGTMRVQLSAGAVSDVGNHIDPSIGDGTFVGIARFSKAGSLRLRTAIERRAMRAGTRSDSYVEAIRDLIEEGEYVSWAAIDQGCWVEIDTPADYERATKLVTAWSGGRTLYGD